MTNESGTSQPITLILVAGFLGAGKTTFLRRALDAAGDHKVGVLVNEWGGVSVDGPMLERDGLQLVEMNSGSIFCACLKGNFIHALQEFSSRDIDVLFVECSGLADPQSMDQLVQDIGPMLKRPFDYRGLMCIVDATTFVDHVDVLLAIQGQVGAADVIVVNKTDLVSTEELEEVHREVRAFNPRAPMLDTTFSDVPVEVLEGPLESYRWKARLWKLDRNRPESFHVVPAGPVTEQQLRDFATALAADSFRVKGFVQGTDGWLRLDAVGPQVEVEQEANEGAAAQPFIDDAGADGVRNCLVVIARAGKVNEEGLRDEWKSVSDIAADVAQV